MELDNLLNNVVAVAAIAGVVGLVIGWLLTYLLIGRGPSKSTLTGKLAAVEEEFETHKENVDKHFETTSELVNDLTESYVKVYKHLSQGAEQLSGVVDMRHRLTLDDDDSTPVIEGAIATSAVTATGVAGAAATATGADADTAAGPESQPDSGIHVEDPEFTVSDAGVAETLTELEANAATALNTPAAPAPHPEPAAEAGAAATPTDASKGTV